MKQLEEILKKAIKVAARRKHMPILVCALIEPDGDGIILTATNLEMRYQANFTGLTINKPVCIDIKKLREVNKAMKGIDSMEVLEDNWVRITGGGAEAKILGLDADDYPSGPDVVDLEEYVAISTEAFARLSSAMSKDETRDNLCGLYIDPKGRLAATDGHRLHFADVTGIEDVIPTIIPAGTVKTLLGFKADSIYIRKDYDCVVCGHGPYKPFDKLTAGEVKTVKKARLDVSIDKSKYFYDYILPDEDKILDDSLMPIPYWGRLSPSEREIFAKRYRKTDEWKGWLTENKIEAFYKKNPIACDACKEPRGLLESKCNSQVLWEDENELLMCRPAEGEFPDYQHVMPSTFSLRYVVKKSSLVGALTMMLPFTDPNQKGVKLHFGPDGDSIRVSTGDTGEIKADLSGNLELLRAPVSPCLKVCHDRNMVSDECTNETKCAALISFNTQTYDFGFNASYLLDAVEYEGNEVTINFNSPTDPCMIGNSLVMPMRV